MKIWSDKFVIYLLLLVLCSGYSYVEFSFEWSQCFHIRARMFHDQCDLKTFTAKPNTLRRIWPIWHFVWNVGPHNKPGHVPHWRVNDLFEWIRRLTWLCFCHKVAPSTTNRLSIDHVPQYLLLRSLSRSLTCQPIFVKIPISTVTGAGSHGYWCCGPWFWDGNYSTSGENTGNRSRYGSSPLATESDWTGQGLTGPYFLD